MGTGYGNGGGEDEKRSAALLDRALQPVPLRGGDAPEIAVRSMAEIERDEAEIGIARQKIGDLQGGGGALRTHPDEMFEPVAGPRAGIEGVMSIDQGHAQILRTRLAEELSEEELTAAAGRRADDLGEASFGQSAGGFVERSPPAGKRTRRLTRGGGKTLGEQLPKFRQL